MSIGEKKIYTCPGKCRDADCDLQYDVWTKRGHMLGPYNPATKQRPRVRWATS